MCKSQIRAHPGVRARGAMLMCDELPNWLLFKGFKRIRRRSQHRPCGLCE